MRIFGEILDGVHYKERKGAYGIAINELNQVAVIQMPHGDFLPGGGIELNETEDECLRRELIEETGYSININSFICNGIQYGYGPKSEIFLKLVGSFYTIQLGHDTGLKSEMDHKLVWKDRKQLKKSIHIEYQYWAIEEAFRLKKLKPLNKNKTYVGISSVDINPFDCISDLVFVKTEIQPADIILVPGGSHPELLMEKAAELYKQGLAPFILPSGHFNPKMPEYSSEWEFLKSLGVKLGVPEDKILKEDQARHTFENAEFSWRVINENKLSVKKVILVCKAYHSRRALLTYQSIFPKDIEFFVASVPGKKEIRKDNWFMDEEKIKIVMGEVVKIGTYFEHLIKSF